MLVLMDCLGGGGGGGGGGMVGGENLLSTLLGTLLMGCLAARSRALVLRPALGRPRNDRWRSRRLRNSHPHDTRRARCSG
jgi:hypothetical protein